MATSRGVIFGLFGVLAGLLAVSPAARAEPLSQSTSGPAPREGTGSATSAAAAELLPPGIRRAVERDALSFTRRASDSSPPRLVEIVEAPSAMGPDGWLEVEYTVDPELEERVRAVLERERVRLGHVILMDPATGRVLAYVSTDPEAFPATRPYPAASLMKIVTAAAMLRADPKVESHACRWVGSPYRLAVAQLEAPPEGGRVDSLWRTLALSNNQCFARYAVHEVGKEALLDEMGWVGLLDPPGAGHAAGRIEPIENALDLGQLGSGLSGSFITPLGAARLAAVLARGERVQPYWIGRVRDADGLPLPVPAREPPEAVWTPDLAETLRNLAVQVTRRGTASRGFRDGEGRLLLEPVGVAGKTGTLHGIDPAGLYQWFIGVAPAAAPRIAIATVVVNDTNAGTGAARVAAQTLREVFCDDSACDASRLEAVYVRARTRDDEARLEEALALSRRSTWTELDQPPRPLGVAPFEFPRALRKRERSGEIVLIVDLSRYGSVQDVRVESSNLPELDQFVVGAVRSWTFTQPTSRGRPVEAQARLPIPIHIR